MLTRSRWCRLTRLRAPDHWWSSVSLPAAAQSLPMFILSMFGHWSARAKNRSIGTTVHLLLFGQRGATTVAVAAQLAMHHYQLLGRILEAMGRWKSKLLDHPEMVYP